MKALVKFFKHLRFHNILQQKEFEQAAQELNILQHDLKEAQAFIKNNKKNFVHKGSKIPKYILIGSARSGKTTLLAQSGLDLTDVNSDQLNNVAPTKNCAWWFTSDAVYLDSAGIYTKPDVERPRDELVWIGFLKELKQRLGKNPLNGVIVVLDLPALSNDKALLQQTLFYLRDRIYEIARVVKNLPIFIVFTKCDLISGFTTFFEHLDAEQRAQIFGIDFTANKKTRDPSQLFNEKFDLLLERITNQLLPRLHQERNLEQRLLLNSFPMQLESLRPFFAEVLNKIPFGANIVLKGVYFTSSIQEGTQIDYLKKQINNLLKADEKSRLASEVQGNHSYFTQELFKKVMQQRKSGIDKEKLKTWFVYASFAFASLIFVAASGVFWYGSYKENRHILQVAKTTLQAPQALNDFDKLKALTDQLDQSEHSSWLMFGINKIHALNKNIKQVYQSVSANSFLVQAKESIENELTTANTASSPRQLYDDIKVYRMLGDAKLLDEPFLKKWFHDYGTAKFSNNLDKQVKLEEAVALVLKHTVKINTDPKIIAQAQQTLRNMPPAQLLFLLLENKHLAQNIPFNAKLIPEVFANFNFDIATMYSADKFKSIYYDEIPAIIAQPKLDDTVFGDNFKIQSAALNKDKLIADVRSIYLENYANTWANACKDISLIEAKDIAQVTRQLNILVDNNSPLIQLLKLIKANTIFDSEPQALTQLINAKLQGLSNVDINSLQINLSALANFFSTINKNQDINRAAFAATASRFQDSAKHDPISFLQNFAAQQPKPLQSWLTTIATNSWQILMQMTQNYLASLWKENVYPQFQKLIENKYPVYKNQDNEMSLSEFNKFFGPNGVIDSFFTLYIKPFVDTDQMYWEWKNFDDKKLNFSQNSLEVFIRAALIQKMYYSEQSLSPLTRFTLTPVAMNPNTQSFSLDLEGQKISYKAGTNKVDQLMWPGPHPGTVKLEFVSKDGKHFSSSLKGPWAWFKLLEKANIQSINNSQHFELTFDLNANSIKYELITADPVSPFLPSIISDFRCPDSL